MPSNRKKPIALVVAEGRSHYSKEQIAQKEAEEVKVDFKDIKPPKDLDKRFRAEFKDLAHKLLTIGIMTELDEEALARYLIAKEGYYEYTVLLNEVMCRPTKKWSEIEQTQNLQDKMFRQVRTAASDLGLTIASRCKLVVPQVEETPKQNKFGKFGG